MLFSVLTCYEVLEDRKVDGVLFAKETSHTWQDVPCIAHDAILIM